jgi:O-antigen ligase
MDNLGNLITLSLAIVTALSFALLGPADFLLVALAAFVLILVLLKPLYGLCFLAFSIPYAGILQLAPKLTANKLFALWVLAAFVFGAMIKKERIEIFSSSTIKYYVAFHLWLLVIFPFGFINVDNIRGIISKFFLLGLVFLIAAMPRDFKQFKVVCIVTAAGSAFLGMYTAFFGMGSLVGEYGTRLAVGTNENVLAHALGVGLLLSLFALRGASKRTKLLILILDIFTLYGILLTGSRGTWLALLFSLVLFPLFTPEIPLKKRLKYVFGGSLAIVVIYLGLTRYYFGQLGQFVGARLAEHESITEAAGGRLDYIWPLYLEKVFQKPILGWGAGYTFNLDIAVHNDFLWIMVESGIIGLGLFLLFIFYCLKDILKSQDSTIKLQALILICFLVFSGLTHNTITLKSFALAVGALCFLAKMCNSEEKTSEGLAPL